MENILYLLSQGFESSSIKTLEFKSFCKKFRHAFIKELKRYYDINCITFNYGHFYISGFFSLEDGRIFYFSIPDVRSPSDQNRMLIRTAKSFKDYTGGSNNFITIKEDMFNFYQLP